MAKNNPYHQRIVIFHNVMTLNGFRMENLNTHIPDHESIAGVDLFHGHTGWDAILKEGVEWIVCRIDALPNLADWEIRYDIPKAVDMIGMCVRNDHDVYFSNTPPEKVRSDDIGSDVERILVTPAAIDEHAMAIRKFYKRRITLPNIDRCEAKSFRMMRKRPPDGKKSRESESDELSPSQEAPLESDEGCGQECIETPDEPGRRRNDSVGQN